MKIEVDINFLKGFGDNLNNKINEKLKNMSNAEKYRSGELLAEKLVELIEIIEFKK